ncbi:hypothetical protein BH09ACT6_BH09ACT6_22510 [soil metagenome]
MPKGVLLLLLAASIAVTGVGCSTNDGSTTQLTGKQLWSQDIASAKARATSDFEMQVFADDKIDEAEYSESMQRYIACLQQGGYPNASLAGPDADGLYHEQTSTPATVSDADFRSAMDAYMEVSKHCAQGTNFLIASLYEEQKKNPEHQDYDVSVVKCLVAGNYVDSSYSVDQFRADSTPNVDGKGSAGTAPYDESDPGVQNCLSDPYTNG